MQLKHGVKTRSQDTETIRGAMACSQDTGPSYKGKKRSYNTVTTWSHDIYQRHGAV